MASRLSGDRVLSKLIYLLAFSLTFYNIGILIADIKVNIPLITILLLDFLFILFGKIVIADLLFFLLFTLVCFFSAAFRYPISSFLPSLALTAALLFPLIVNWKFYKVDKEKLLNYLVLGALFSIFYIPFELYFRYMHMLEYSGNELWISLGGSSHRFYRASSLMLEPSHFTVVLFFIYILIDFAKTRGYYVKHSALYKYSFFVALVLGVSLSGIAMILIYYFLKALNYFYMILISKITITIKKRSILIILGVSIFVLVANGLSHNFIGKVASKIHERVLLTKNVIAHQKAEGSSGVRTSFIWVSKTFITESPVTHVVFGEGYSNFRNWLLNNEKLVGYKTGEIYNLLLVVLLSTGILGLIAFIFMIIKLTGINFLNYNEVVFLIMIFVSFFTHGYLMMYWTWIPMLLFKIVKTETEK